MDLIGWIVGLPDGQRRLLGDAARAGRLRTPTAAVLRGYGLPAEWAVPLGAAKPAELAALALVVEAVERGGAAGGVLPICTRPSGDVVDTAVAVRQMFTQAEREVLIAGFRITEREQLEPLGRSANDALDVRLFVDLDPCVDVDGRSQAPADPQTWPQVWWERFVARVWPEGLTPPRCWALAAEPEVRRSMHAKTVVTDRRSWLVTSANFTARGHERNLEVGALIEDPRRAAEVVGLFDEWLGAGVFRRVG